MDVNCCHTIDDASRETMRLLSDLIEASRTEEQMVYREAEIDELWRLLQGTQAGSETIGEVVAVHDLLEIPGNAREAAGRLRALAGQHGGQHGD